MTRLALHHHCFLRANQVTTCWTRCAWNVSVAQQTLIDSAWHLAMQQSGRCLFDGPLCRMEGFTTGGDRLTIQLSRTSYRIFWGTNVSHPEWADQFGSSVMANPVGLSAALETSDGFLMLGRRNTKVAYYPGRVHPFAGSMEPGDSNAEPGSPGPDPFADVQRELSEELGFVSNDVESIHLTGIVEDTLLRQPEVIFAAKTRLTRSNIEQQLNEAEHRGAVAVETTADAIVAACTDPDFTPVAVASLLLWGRQAFGIGWFTTAWETASAALSKA